MLPFLVDDLELEKDFISPPLNLDHVRVERLKDGNRVVVLEPRLEDTNSLVKFSCRDFQLQEILESGSYDLLVPVQPIKLNPLTSFDVAEKASLSLNDYLDRLAADQSAPVDVEPQSSEK